MDERQQARARLALWASERGISTDPDGYVEELSQNLFVRLSPATVEDLTHGRGEELGSSDARGKIQALHSSSALACNVFEYWRQKKDRSVLEEALGVESNIRSISFEVAFSNGLGGTNPHLDVVLETEHGLIGIESKFLEPYRGSRKSSPFAKSYFPAGRRRWAEAGLPECQEMAEELADGRVGFEVLDAPQLLKHALGLWRAGPEEVRLWYLWADLGGSCGQRHRAKLRAFQERVGRELQFVACPYDVLIERMGEADGEGTHGRYLRYLRNRYGNLPAEEIDPGAGIRSHD